MTMPRSLAKVQGQQRLLDQLNNLTQAMRAPLRERQLITDQATHLSLEFGRTPPPRQLLNDLIADYRRAPADWDNAAQLYLAIAALGHDAWDPDQIRQLAESLTFAPGLDSPRSENPNKRFDDKLEAFDASFKQKPK
jgi:hypothetical protein